MNEGRPIQPRGVTKLSFNVSQTQLETLKRLSRKNGKSMTEILRHAIELENYVQAEVDKGSTIIVRERDGDQKELVLGEVE